MADLRDRRVIIGIAAGLLILAGSIVTVVLVSNPSREASSPENSQVGLVVQTGKNDDLKLDPQRPVRCFVGGRRVGDLLLNDCARRNGVAPGALDVGLDASGALAAANGSATPLTPLPPQTPADVQAQTVATSNGGASDTCWRHVASAARQLPGTMSLDACVQALFAGRCLTDEDTPELGRWGAETLRLEPGEVDISEDGNDFRPIAAQSPDCSIPPVSSAGQGL